jgi:hypothetical protein
MLQTAFSLTKRNFKRWPIIEVEESEFNDNSIAARYTDTPFVWILNKRYKDQIIDDFDYNFYPEEKETEYLFARCFFESKKPIDWNVIKLVPTNVISNTVKSKSIASYTYADVYFYSMLDRNITKKLLEKPKELRYKLIRPKQNLDEIIFSIDLHRLSVSHVWLIDLDVDVDLRYNFNIKPDNTDTIYYIPVKHKSTGLIYADYSAMLIPVDYIRHIQAKTKDKISHLIKTSVLETEPVGVLNDLTDPKFAWVRSYATSGLLYKNKILLSNKSQKNKILSAYMSLSGDLLSSRYAIDGSTLALIDIENNLNIDYCNFIELDKRFDEYNNTNSNLQDKRIKENILKSKIDKIAKIYGTESEEYKKLEIELKSI